MFENIIGQKATVETLRRELAAGRLPAAILLSGPRYSGKLSAALEIARVLTCGQRGEWSCACPSCRRQRLLVHPATLLAGCALFRGGHRRRGGLPAPGRHAAGPLPVHPRGAQAHPALRPAAVGRGGEPPEAAGRLPGPGGGSAGRPVAGGGRQEASRRRRSWSGAWKSCCPDAGSWRGPCPPANIPIRPAAPGRLLAAPDRPGPRRAEGADPGERRRGCWKPPPTPCSRPWRSRPGTPSSILTTTRRAALAPTVLSRLRTIHVRGARPGGNRGGAVAHLPGGDGHYASLREYFLPWQEVDPRRAGVAGPQLRGGLLPAAGRSRRRRCWTG